MIQHKLLYRIVASFLTITMVSTAIGRNMSVHYCQDEAFSVNFFGQAESCEGNSKHEKPDQCKHHKKHKCCHHKKSKLKKSSEPKDGLHEKNCCSDEVLSTNLNAENSGETESGVVVNKTLITTVVAILPSNLFLATSKTYLPDKVKPPLPKRDINSLLQRMRC